MSVQMQQFRVVGVDQNTGEDVSVVIDAATKAAAEVKAEQMRIETTHIVRLKAEGDAPPDESELFSAEAAEALAGRRTDQLIEGVIQPDEARESPATTAPPPEPNAPQQPSKAEELVVAVTRPNYTASSSQRKEPATRATGGASAFAFVLIVLMGIAAGAYFVLVHEPNKTNADSQELVFGKDLFIDVLGSEPGAKKPANVRDAFGPATADPPYDPRTNPDDRLVITPGGAGAVAAGNEPVKPAGDSAAVPALVLQSVVTSHEGRFAVINGKLYKQGAVLAGCTLISVADDWVLMERLGEQFVLQIEANDEGE